MIDEKKFQDAGFQRNKFLNVANFFLAQARAPWFYQHIIFSTIDPLVVSTVDLYKPLSEKFYNKLKTG